MAPTKFDAFLSICPCTYCFGLCCVMFHSPKGSAIFKLALAALTILLIAIILGFTLIGVPIATILGFVVIGMACVVGVKVCLMGPDDKKEPDETRPMVGPDDAPKLGSLVTNWTLSGGKQMFVVPVGEEA